jgi:PAS domain-containing protein
VDGRRQKNLVLILAREFASKLAHAMLVVDADGTLVYYNEPAEVLMGRPFAEAGELSADRWASAFRTETIDGEPMPLEELPSGIALLRREPASGPVRFTGLDGVPRTVSVTGIPLFAHRDEFVGAVAIFWELDGQTEDA